MNQGGTNIKPVKPFKEDLDAKEKLLLLEKPALMKILKILEPFNADSRTKLLKASKDFYNLYIGD